VEIDPTTVRAGGLLRVDACGVCGSDVASYRGTGSVRTYPTVLGHEVVGRIEALWGDPPWTSLAEGDRVVVEEVVPCRACSRCTSGRYRMCTAYRRYGSTPLSVPPGMWGGYSQFMYLDPRSVLRRVPDSLDAHLATLFIPVSNGFGWLRDAGEIRPGDDVVVIGPGQHGLGCLLAARAMSSGRVVVVGRPEDEARLELASTLGADAVLTGSPAELRGAVEQLTDGRGADVVVDATDSPSVVGLAVTLAGVGGRVVVAGAKRGKPATDLDTDQLYLREITMRGVYARDGWAVDAAIRFLSENAASLGALAGRRIEMDQLPSLLEDLAEGREQETVHFSVAPNTT
jgi:threonine dehydrogenase-like Zn-dependent dehydrogenase